MMKSRTEELLYCLLWTCDQLTRPTFRNLTDSFEQWSYRAGLSRQIAELGRRKLIEDETASTPPSNRPILSRAVRLTDAGRIQALGGRDPVQCWNRPWDGRWRLILFDIPNQQAVMRARLRRYLRGEGFGCLQESVWTSPHPIEGEQALLTGAKVDVNSLILMEARPCAGEKDDEIVAGAWDFSALDKAYSNYRAILDSSPKATIRNENHAREFRDWARREREAWLKVAWIDPFLPTALLPANYQGREAWTERLAAWKAVAKQLRQFNPPSQTRNQAQHAHDG